MSARPSRLHALERGLKTPRKSRAQSQAKARALTVMRLEGATTAVRSNIAHPARLPKDMEDQIAVVRGHAIGKPSRGLLELEERLLRSGPAGPTTAAIQRHAHSSSPLPSAPASHAHALSMSTMANDFGGGYQVESFEDTSIATVPPQTRLAPVTPSAAVTATPAPTVARCAEPSTAIVAREVPEAPARNDITRRTALTSDHEAVAANFERDIAAMLGTPSTASTPENQQWDNTVRNATTAPSVTPPPAPPGSPPIAPDPAVTPKQNGHDVFNQMGLTMNYANSFDLGVMDLSARFDRFDEELSMNAKPSTGTSTAYTSTASPRPTSVQAMALDDFDLVADLAEISGAQSAPGPAAAVTTNEPCVTKEEPLPATTAPSHEQSDKNIA